MSTGLISSSVKLGTTGPSPDLMPRWTYDWSATPAGAWCQPVCEAVPMLWGLRDTDVRQWSVSRGGGGGLLPGSAILAFNEPDCAGQSNLTVAQAVDGWQRYLEPLSASARLVAPAVTNSHQHGQGLEWLTAFLASCEPCQISAIAVHWYGLVDGEGLGNLPSFLESVHAVAQRPIWLTEFGAVNSDAATRATFLRHAVPYLDGLAYLERYALAVSSAAAAAPPPPGQDRYEMFTVADARA